MLNAVLPSARLRSRALLAGALVLVCGVFAAGPARAATPAPSAVTCSGHADRGADAAQPDRIDVAFGCSGDIKSFTVISSALIGGFEVSAEVYDHTTQAIVESDSFFCEGLIPGDGFNCAGAAHAGKDVKTAFELNEPVCSDTEATLPLKVQVVISDANGATAGPFRLRGPEACPSPKPAKPAKPAGGKRRHHRGGGKGGASHGAAKRHAR
jgi:hypothetical protein